MTAWVQAMETVVRERRPALVGYAYLLTGSRSEAEDLVQEAIVRTFARGRTKTSVREAEAYIKRAMANDAINRLRHRIVVESRQPVLATAGSAPSHDTEVLARADIATALDTLSPRERTVAVLKYMDDLTIAQIAAILRLNEGTVKRYLSNAAARLRDLLGEDAVAEAERVTVPVRTREGGH